MRERESERERGGRERAKKKGRQKRIGVRSRKPDDTAAMKVATVVLVAVMVATATQWWLDSGRENEKGAPRRVWFGKRGG